MTALASVSIRHVMELRAIRGADRPGSDSELNSTMNSTCPRRLASVTVVSRRLERQHGQACASAAASAPAAQRRAAGQ